jgi:uncharacterized protein (TIGR03086 family)
VIGNHPAPLLGGLGLLERALGYTLGSLRLVTPAALGRPTPCAGWDLATLLAHLDDSLAALHEAAEPGAVRPRPAARSEFASPADPATPAPPGTAADPARRLRDRACRLLGAWTAAAAAGGGPEVSVDGLPLTAGLLTGVGAMEVAVHGWDVARGCGADRPIPPSLADELLDLATVIVDDADRPTRFGPAVAVHLAAGPADRLVAFLGREPGRLLG